MWHRSSGVKGVAGLMEDMVVAQGRGWVGWENHRRKIKGSDYQDVGNKDFVDGEEEDFIGTAGEELS
jgi:hypothetical protein